MLDVANEHILAEKSLKILLFGQIPKKWKKPTQKKIVLFYLNK
jgi:hypothetical protein